MDSKKSARRREWREIVSMKRSRKILLALMASAMVCSLGISWADGMNEAGGSDDKSFRNAKPGVPPVVKGSYQTECGRCHFPYSAGLLPALSWEKIMLGMKDHFGEQVELSPQSTRAIYDYLLTNAAGRVSYRISGRIMGSLGADPAPQRITETDYFRNRHQVVDVNRLRDDPKVKSIGNCGACHPRAMEGSFKAGEVISPSDG